jgi:hypothetical protein
MGSGLEGDGFTQQRRWNCLRLFSNFIIGGNNYLLLFHNLFFSIFIVDSHLLLSNVTLTSSKFSSLNFSPLGAEMTKKSLTDGHTD